MLPTLAFLSLILAQLCLALPIINSADLALPPLNSELPIESFDMLDSSDGCNNIDGCRTLSQIIVSCLGTIFACVWVAVHRDIPQPKYSWLRVQIGWIGVVFVTLFVPELALAWAVQQFLQAREYAKLLEVARLQATPL